MTIITKNDIIAELESMNAAEEPKLFDFARLFFGQVKPVWAVVGHAVCSYPEDREFGIFGLYESREDAEKVASLLAERAEIQRKKSWDQSTNWDKLADDEWTELCLFDSVWEFKTKELFVNDSPVNENGFIDPQIRF